MYVLGFDPGDQSDLGRAILEVNDARRKDASLAAFSALSFEQKTSGWSDLVLLEQDPFFPSGRSVNYWFPLPP